MNSYHLDGIIDDDSASIRRRKAEARSGRWSRSQREAAHVYPADAPTRFDVLNGRGQNIQNHPGNVNYRTLVFLNKEIYNKCPRHDKIKISRCIVAAVRELGGRFLEIDTRSGTHHDIGDREAVKKTSQALREARGQRCKWQKVYCELISNEIENLSTCSGKRVISSDEESLSDNEVSEPREGAEEAPATVPVEGCPDSAQGSGPMRTPAAAAVGYRLGRENLTIHPVEIIPEETQSSYF